MLATGARIGWQDILSGWRRSASKVKDLIKKEGGRMGKEMELPDVSLANLMGGQAVEWFDSELQKVVENIVDPNTPPTAKREITLKLTIKPDKNRDMACPELTVTSKLAGGEKKMTRVFIALTKGGPVLTESNPHQPQLPEITQGDNVTHLRSVAGGATI